VLGGVALCDAPGAVDWPEQRLRMPTDGATDARRREAWWTDGGIEQGVFEGIHWRATPGLLFGVLECDEAGDPAQRRGEALRELTRRAYERVFALLEQRGLPHLWRVWNHLTDINGALDGLERYRWFNLGRHEAYQARGALARHALPAVSALGWAEGPLSIAFLAGRVPPTPIENPRQLSAFHYPSAYGPRPPLFARAVLVPGGSHEFLLVSGTASIVGHASLHAGDVVAQCEETARNLHALLHEANRATRSTGFTADGWMHRVYVRHAAHAAAVRQCLQRCLGGTVLGVVQADVCRRELLVEVESLALAPLKA